MRIITHLILPRLCMAAFCAAFALLCAMPCSAANLSRQEAERILLDTHTISRYVGLNGESDYAGKPQNIIFAALFGAFDAKMYYAYEQEELREQGKKPKSPAAPVFTAGGRSLAPSQVLVRDDAPDMFKGLPEEYTAFISREAAEIAALRYTGHALAKHEAPQGHDLFGKVILDAKGYYVCIDGLGDLPEDVVLKQFSSSGKGFLLRGEITQSMGDEGDEGPETFRLELTPGDAPGTWKRQYTIRQGR